MALKAGIDLSLVGDVVLDMVTVLKQPGLDGNIRIWYENMLEYACRKMEEFVDPEVSVAAQKEAKKLQLRLSEYRYCDQPKFDKGREVFHWEHVMPVSEMKRRLVGDETRIATKEDVMSVLKRTDIAWILKDEDRKLVSYGYRSSRLENPWEAYDKAKIEIL